MPALEQLEQRFPALIPHTRHVSSHLALIRLGGDEGAGWAATAQDDVRTGLCELVQRSWRVRASGRSGKAGNVSREGSEPGERAHDPVATLSSSPPKLQLRLHLALAADALSHLARMAPGSRAQALRGLRRPHGAALLGVSGRRLLQQGAPEARASSSELSQCPDPADHERVRRSGRLTRPSAARARPALSPCCRSRQTSSRAPLCALTSSSARGPSGSPRCEGSSTMLATNRPSWASRAPRPPQARARARS